MPVLNLNSTGPKKVSSSRTPMLPSFCYLLCDSLSPLPCSVQKSPNCYRSHSSPSMVKSILFIHSRQRYENVSVCKVAWCWIQCSSQLTPFLRLMTSDRSRATRETILIVSERILHWHIPGLTANVFCFKSDSRTTVTFITWFLTYK